MRKVKDYKFNAHAETRDFEQMSTQMADAIIQNGNLIVVLKEEELGTVTPKSNGAGEASFDG